MTKILKSATLSDCGRYRYSLTRHWDPVVIPLGFIMLNPSTADADVDDPTIRRCVGFARREGYGGITVCNLFGYRATKPADLRTAADPYGPENGTYLAMLLASPAPVVAAWGVHGAYRGAGAQLKAVTHAAGVTMRHLGLTRDGHPKHPLYIKGDQPLETWA